MPGLKAVKVMAMLMISNTGNFSLPKMHQLRRAPPGAAHSAKAHVGGESRQEEVGDKLEVHLLNGLAHSCACLLVVDHKHLHPRVAACDTVIRFTRRRFTCSGL